MDDRVLLNFIGIDDIPQKYPARNILYKDKLITHTYLLTLQRFGITNLDEALKNNENLLLIGQPIPALGEFSKPLEGFKCIEPRRIISRK